MNVNLKSMFYTCKEVIPIMRAKNYGKIVNISSVSALGNIGQANYAASKAAIQGLTYTLAKENGPKNITVNAVAPGYIATDMLKSVPEDIQESWKKEIPLRRFSDPMELANVVYFLSTDESSWVTGQCIYASGGRLI